MYTCVCPSVLMSWTILMITWALILFTVYYCKTIDLEPLQEQPFTLASLFCTHMIYCLSSVWELLPSQCPPVQQQRQDPDPAHHAVFLRRWLLGSHTGIGDKHKQDTVGCSDRRLAAKANAHFFCGIQLRVIFLPPLPLPPAGRDNFRLGAAAKLPVNCSVSVCCNRKF